METRRIITHTARSIDKEKLTIISIYEPGINKQQIKKDIRYTKRHQVLVPNGDSYRYKE